MRNYQITTRPVIVEANSYEEALRLAPSAIVIEVEEVMSVDSILEDVLGKDDAALFHETLPKS